MNQVGKTKQYTLSGEDEVNPSEGEGSDPTESESRKGTCDQANTIYT